MSHDQLIDRGITSPRVFAALIKVKRDLFVTPECIGAAYEDRPLPIGFDQTISQPYMVGLMTDLLNPAPSDHILEIGTGSGYQAAILAELVNHVYSIEIIPELADQAQKRLFKLGYQNVSIRNGDGYFGWPEKGPFDGIVVTAAPQTVPPHLLDQLKPGGRLVIPMGATDALQELFLIEKDREEHVIQKAVVPVRFVPFTRE